MTWHRSASDDDVRRVFVQRSPGEESIISLITHFSPGIQKEQSLVKEQLQRNRHTRAERAVCVCVMRKFKTSELGKKKKRKGKLDCALRPGRRAGKKKEQDASGSAEAAENSNSAIRPADAFDRQHTRAHTRTRDVICSREATVFWSSRMIDRFHRYTSSSVSHILFQHFDPFNPTS